MVDTAGLAKNDAARLITAAKRVPNTDAKAFWLLRAAP